jgi:ElaB/YqjD/DUF883 family membrane-anchored ribosome-binding protein
MDNDLRMKPPLDMSNGLTKHGFRCHRLDTYQGGNGGTWNYISMAKRESHRAELNELATELARPAAGRRQADDPLAASGDPSDRALEIEKLIRELRGKLTEAADDAEYLVTAHPFAAVASALLLGIVIGRMMGRR